MELQRLRLFVAAAKAGGFSQAAREEFMSHSTLSRAVAGLERELGVELFRRNNHGLELSYAGALLLEEAEKLLAAADELEEKLRKLPKEMP